MTVCVITGGGRGIGAATALRFAATGSSLVLTWKDHEASAQSVADRCRERGVRAVAVQADVAQEPDVAALCERADELGPLSALINNAGVIGLQGRLDSFTVERMRGMLLTNVLGTLLCCQAAIRRMSIKYGGRGGAIVNVSSRAAVLGAAGEYVDYAASKGAVDSLTVGLAKEVGGEGIRVNAVRPALVRTDIHASGGDPGRVDRLATGAPMRRGGEADEVAAAIAWLVSPDSSYVNGALLDVAGGW